MNPPTICCSLCFFLDPDVKRPALTVLNGHAVCREHLGDAACGDFNAALRSAEDFAEMDQ